MEVSIKETDLKDIESISQEFIDKLKSEGYSNTQISLIATTIEFKISTIQSLNRLKFLKVEP